MLSLRNLYEPIQPAFMLKSKIVEYSEILPDSQLGSFVFCYWRLKTHEPLKSSYTYKVVPDGCTDVFFEISNPNKSFVMGFCEKYTEFEIGNRFNYVGVRFLPTIFTQIFKTKAAELSNKFEDLNLVASEFDSFIANKMTPNLNNDEVKLLFDQYFISKLGKINFDYDKRLYRAIELIYKTKGSINIENDIDTGISKRQLRRVFEHYVGDSIKSFSKVVRLQNIIHQAHNDQSLSNDFGYFDQAHFIKDFKYLMGETPSKALKK